jgi:hypothetical protein
MVLFWMLAIALFALEAWNSRFVMSWDGIQYLDDADLYYRGDWANAANSQWSPMYVWVVGAFLHLLHPPSYWQFPVVHLANFFIAIFSLAGFQFFLSSLLRSMRGRLGAIPEWTVVVLGFAAFLYTTLDFTNLGVVTPDLLMHAFVYLVAGYMLRIVSGDRRNRDFVVLGLLLGLGYLAKAPFFFYTFACLGILFLAMRAKGIPKLAIALASFLLIAGPYIAFLSHYKHRFTYGDSGRYNVVWMLNGVPYYHWHGQQPGSGTPLHATRQISADPPAYEFARPVAGTYPPWFDPIYWNEGAQPHYRLSEMARAAVSGVKLYEYWTHHRQLTLVAGLLILMLATPNKMLLVRRLAGNSPLLAFGLFPFAMYALVHQDSRFLSSFFVLVWMALFAAALEAQPAILTGVVKSVVVVVGALMLVECLIAATSRDFQGTQDIPIAGNYPNPHWEVAHELNLLGVQTGDPVAIVGNHLPYFWARLAGVRIVSEVLMSDPPCGGQGCEDQSAAQWMKVKGALAATGAKVVVSPCIHGVVDQAGWVQLGATGIFAYRF